MLSVLMTVYEKEKAKYLRESLESIRSQTLQADEVVLVKDGKLPEPLEQAISTFQQSLPLNVVSLPKVGRCKALRTGVEQSRGELIAIMDSDDLSLPHRLQSQMAVMSAHPEVDAVGSAIAEFASDPLQATRIRRMPCSHRQIAAYARRRNPFNQVSVMLRREAVLRAGNYRQSPGFEDWHLWNRMLQTGSRFMNLDDVLVLVRVGNGMWKRRSGLRYIRQEISFHRDMYKAEFLSPGEVLRNLALRIPVRLAPERVLRTIYTRALRTPA
jgi:glycosyltransferase involved in cell wall biosynthesis